MLTGGLAAKAGEGYAAAAAKASEAAAKPESALQATEKGAFALGKTLAKAKRANEEATESPMQKTIPSKPSSRCWQRTSASRSHLRRRTTADKSAAENALDKAFTLVSLLLSLRKSSTQATRTRQLRVLVCSLAVAWADVL